MKQQELENRFPKRKSMRLKEYDYTTAGLYFITICCENRKEYFGQINNCEMKLNAAGKIVDETWNDLINHISNIELDYYVIMPEHFHGIVFLHNDARVGFEPTPTKKISLFEVVRQFKTFSGKRINMLNNTPGNPIWQKGYYERIIRSENELNNIRKYIIENPTKRGINIETLFDATIFTPIKNFPLR